MVTEIGFVSLLVAAFGVLAGGLVYLGVRVARGPVGEGADRGGDDSRPQVSREVRA